MASKVKVDTIEQLGSSGRKDYLMSYIDNNQTKYQDVIYEGDRI